MVPLGGLYEPWGSMANPALYLMMGMILIPMIVAYLVARGELNKKDKKYDHSKKKTK